MNVALDALWWRLQHPQVRDLAALLTAPPPWLTGRELALPQLLGEHGFRYLLALDAAPAPLTTWLAEESVNRLGRYAERLLMFWFANAPHCELVSANLAVHDGKDTVGEYDFLVRIDGEPWHLELACKYYMMLGEGPDTLVGPSLRDAWRLKYHKLHHQLGLSGRAPGRAALPNGFDGARCASVLRGTLCYRDGPWLAEPLSPLQWHGWWRPLGEAWPVSRDDSRWVWLPRLRWLSPARVDEALVQRMEDLQAQLAGNDVPQLVAECEKRPDGHWHEIARGFVVPIGWPNAERLDALMRRAGSLA
jgi:hypothetical protein